MISFPDLDFFSVVSSGTTSNRYLAKEQFPESDWNIVDIEWTKAHWPLETNTPGLSLGRILSPVPSSETTEGPIILPRSLRLYDEYCSTYGSNISPLLKVLGPHLEEILFQPRVTRWDWAAVCNHVIAHCPQLDRAVTLHVESAEDGARPAKGTRLTPRTTMHILETEDWRVPEEEDSTSTSDNGGDEAPELAEWEVDTSKVQVNTSDKMITRASHVVAFQEEPNSSWKSKHLDSAIHRKEPAFDPRWLAEALTDIEETRDVEEFRKNYECSWADLIPRYNYYFVASRKPKEISV
ncbi:hypothetical protein FS842_006381 [Serendipita sp. 407]|nr:hypothetical protein FS842_006381 [Serendipita sp. 407]